MTLVIQIIISLLVIGLVVFLNKWFKTLKLRKQFSWIPHAPRVPILGSVFEFGDSSRIINDVLRFTNNPKKICYSEIMFYSMIIVKDYDFMEFIMTSNSILNKSSEYDYILNWLGRGLLTAEATKWKKRRRIITPTFHFSILEQFVDVFEYNGNIMIKKLYDEAVDKDVVDIYKYITACALDIISETAMGVNVDTQQNKNKEYVNAVKDMCRIAVVRIFSAWKRFDFLFQFCEDGKKQVRDLKVLHGFTNKVIEQRRKELLEKKSDQSEAKDDLGRKRKMAFLDMLLNSTIDGKPLSQEDIREEVDTFMFEGHDTTSAAISSTLFLLANHPEVQKKAREEQKELYAEDRDAMTTYLMLHDMKYLDLVIKEALRLYPPVPIIARVLDEDTEYKGHIIPKGTPITLFIYGINRDPDLHKSPDEFIPERFINDERLPFSYVPFSAGPRNCIGQKFAILEMKSVISKILRHFELCPTNPPHKIKYVMEGVLKAGNGVNIVLKRHKW